MKENEIISKYGITLMVDALGVRNATIDESKSFIKNINKIKKGLPAFMLGYFSEEDEQKKKLENEPPNILTFGDTLLLTWEMQGKDVGKYLIHIAPTLSYLIVKGLLNGLLFRGALSVGEYIEKETTVLGPAITDVASWYDLSECFGIFATPYCGQFISKINSENKIYENDFIKYQLPLKGNISQEFWVVPWPSFLHLISKTKNNISYYYSLIQKLSIPKGTEQKYFYTEQFVKSILDKKT